MFTGLVAGTGEVTATTASSADRDAVFSIAAPPGLLDGVSLGASISCSGCCLTAVAIHDSRFDVSVSAETLAVSTLAEWGPGRVVNLERSLRVGDELGGHLVYGHVDGIGLLLSATPEHGSVRLVFGMPPALARYVAVKGSIAVDGVSLTVNAVGDADFAVNIIPHTAAATTLGALMPGAAVNLEIDTLARYVARLADTGPAAAGSA